VGAVRGPNDSEEPGYANDYDCRSPFREVSFQVHGIDVDGNLVVRRQLKRRYSFVLSEVAVVPGWHRGMCIIAFWSRELQALGHTAPAADTDSHVAEHKSLGAVHGRAAHANTRCGLLVARPGMSRQ
jgi:hypothetical protein